MKILLKILKRSVWTLVSIFFTVLFVVFLVAEPIATHPERAGWINKYLGINPYETVIDKNDAGDTEYFKSDFVLKDENGVPLTVTDEDGYEHQVYDDVAMRANSMDVATRVATEGSVLMWNNDVAANTPALPLNSGAQISFFGVGAIDYTHHGGGSGSVSITTTKTVKSACESEGLKVNNALWSAYRLSKAGYGRVYGHDAQGNGVADNNYVEFKIGEIPWNVLTKKIAMPSGIGQYGDAAVMVISRYGSEDGDTSFTCKECHNDNYMDLAFEEDKVLSELDKLRANGTIKRVILLINSPAAMSLKNIEKHNIDACVWVGLGGNASYDQIGKILSGSAAPSGHLNDIWVNDIRSAPATENFGDYTFKQSAGVPADAAYTHNTKYVVYQEGIYVGYRYYETRYEDYVLGAGNAGGNSGVKAGENGWSYSDEVGYSFGHGLTYTTFAQSDFAVQKTDDGYSVSVKVTNTGKNSGKDVVQVYLQKPYTDYDKDVNHIVEKPAVELVGFAKTPELAPGESKTLTVNVKDYDFKSYDAYGQKTYILEKGDYYLAAGTSAHDALNNILIKKGVTDAQKARMVGSGNADFAYKITVAADDFDKYAVSSFTGKPVTNQFDNADVNIYQGTKDQKITYLSRNDWVGTYPSAVSLTCTDPQMIKDMQYAVEIAEDENAKIPEFYGTVTSTIEGLGENGLTLAMLMELDYDDPMWNDLLNQLTWEEQCTLITYGSAAVAGATSVAAPMYTSQDGPCGIRQGAGTLDTQMAFPCNGLVAATFDEELIEELGNAFAHEILHIGCVGIYGLGANIHRSAWSGRSWEYYSEDGFLSGKAFSAESQGMTKKGVVLFTKHFALNDQERNRYGGSVWANEQSIREVYLKAFEAGITEGHTNGLMSSFNRIGCTWAGAHKGLLTEVLRNEWNFIGQVETDAGVGTHMLTPEARAAGVVAGQDIWMSGPDVHAFDNYKNNATVCAAMREACHRILYTTLNSKAMNKLSNNSKVIYHTPWWQTLITSMQITFGIIAGVCIAVTVAAFVLAYLDKKRNGEKTDTSKQGGI